MPRPRDRHDYSRFVMMVLAYIVASSIPFSTFASNVKRTTLWQPPVGSTFNYQLSVTPTAAQLANPEQFNIWVFDLFDIPQSSIETIQNTTSKVVCYFSAGTFEPNRPDSGNFTAADQGKTLDDWPDEKWLNVSSEKVRDIMKARLDLAQAKGCAGVDPDNVDGYDNDNGLGLTRNDSIDYLRFLAAEASTRGLSIGLKNAGDTIGDVLDVMQWSVNEQCTQYDECETYEPFIDAGKPFFNIEYPKGDNVNTDNVTTAQYQRACDDPKAKKFTKIIKNINLDTWVEVCTTNEGATPATSMATSGPAPLTCLAFGSLALIFLL